MARRLRSGMTKVRRYALMVSAPTHALLAPQWLRKHRPLVFVLTKSAETRTLTQVSHMLQILGCRLGGIFGRLTEQQLIVACEQGSPTLFKSLALELADHLMREVVDEVFVAPAEPHELGSLVCRWLVDAAVQLAGSHRPDLQAKIYSSRAPRHADVLPFSPRHADAGLLAVRDELRSFVQGDLAWAA
jgi:hypothetical protein